MKNEEDIKDKLKEYKKTLNYLRLEHEADYVYSQVLIGKIKLLEWILE